MSVLALFFSSTRFFENPAIFPVLTATFSAFAFYCYLAFKGLLQHMQLLVQFCHLLALSANFAHRV